MPSQDENFEPNRCERVDAHKLRKGPLLREALTDAQVKRLRAVFSHLAPFLDETFEQFEIDFLRDAHPDREIGVWEQIASAHRDFVQQHPAASSDGGHDVFRCVLLISVGALQPPEIPSLLWNAVAEHCRNY
jgi:hypothetical protein